MRPDIVNPAIVAAKAAEKEAFWHWQQCVQRRCNATLFHDQAEKEAYEAWCAASKEHDRLLDAYLGDRRRLNLDHGN